DLHHVLLGGGAGGEQAQLFSGSYKLLLFREHALELSSCGCSRKYFIHELFDGWHQWQLPAHSPLQQKSGNDKAINFVRAFEDAIDSGITVRSLRWILLDKAIAGINLQSLIHNIIEHLRRPHLNNRTLDRILFNRLESLLACITGGFVYNGKGCVHHAHCAEHQRLADIDERGHVCQLFAHQTEIGDNFFEGLALLGVADCVIQGFARTAYAHGAKLESADVQDIKGDDVAAADFA